MNTNTIKTEPLNNLYILNPTLESLLKLCDNPKDAASLANTEYSNFLKQCKLDTNIRLDTYTKCANGFGMDVLLIHLPKGIISSSVKTTEYVNKHYKVIEQENLIFLLNKLCEIDSERVEQHILQALHQLNDTQILQQQKSFVCKLRKAIKLFIESYDEPKY